jgi:4'-phosphopantetheinyl transferase
MSRCVASRKHGHAMKCEPVFELDCLSLQENAVQVWELKDFSSEQACAAFTRTLSADERQRASAYRREQDRLRFIARRGTLRWLIGGYLDCAPDSLRFQTTRLGKPALLSPDAQSLAGRLAFSVSQTDGTALLAFAWDCRLGVDVERVVGGIDVTGVARQVFSPAESVALDAARRDPSAAFFSTWTRKEALLKALGTGLSGEPRSYSTHGDPRCRATHWAASQEGSIMSGWTCRELATGQDFRGALAVSLDNARVSLNPLPLSM